MICKSYVYANNDCGCFIHEFLRSTVNIHNKTGALRNVGRVMFQLFFLNLVAQALKYVKWVEFSPHHCLSSVASGNNTLQGPLSIEFSDLRLYYYFETKPKVL